MPPAAPKKIIFAVDDEPDNLDLIQRALGNMYDIRRFADGKSALAEASKTPPAAVLVDFRMPDMSGADVLRGLRKAGIQCAALMVTAYGDFEEVARVRSENLAFRILSKPWDPEDLRAQVNLALSLTNLDKTVASLHAAKAKT